MDVSAEQVRELREKTGAGIVDCKKALTEVSGDMEKAVDHLRKKGLASVANKAGRTAAEGLVASYIHAGGKIGVLLELNCETDFVAKTNEFQGLVRDLTMHVAAANPLYVRREEVPASFLDKEREIYREQAKGLNKPAAVIEKILEGKIDKYFSEICLLEQPFVKEPEKTVELIVNEMAAKIGEKVSVRRFTRYQLGEGIAKKTENLAEEVAKQLA